MFFSKKWVVLLACSLLGAPSAIGGLGRNLITHPLHLKSGEVLEAKIQTPQSGCSSNCPAFILLGGFESAGHVIELLPAQLPFYLASVDYAYLGSRKFSFPGTLLEAPRLKKALGVSLEAIQELFRFLETFPGVNPKRIGVLGASFGSPFAVIAAAREPKIHEIVLVHGFGDIRKTIQHRLHQVLERKAGWIGGPLSWFAAGAITIYMDPPNLEQSAKSLNQEQRVLVVEAQDDQFIPSSARTQLWSSLSESRAALRRVQMTGGHLQPGSDKLILKILSEVNAWLSEPTNS